MKDDARQNLANQNTPVQRISGAIEFFRGFVYDLRCVWTEWRDARFARKHPEITPTMHHYIRSVYAGCQSVKPNLHRPIALKTAVRHLENCNVCKPHRDVVSGYTEDHLAGRVLVPPAETAGK